MKSWSEFQQKNQNKMLCELGLIIFKKVAI